MNNVLNVIHRMVTLTDVFEKLKAPLWLLARLYVAEIFFLSGLTKLNNWDTTLYLFESEYAVPFLNTEVAAWLGTFGEIVFPVLLVLGLFTRLCALGLFIVNFVAVISLSEITQAALNQHYLWGVMLLTITVTGGACLTLDRLIKRFQSSSGTL